jgi:putative inorganic carbon (hco3(-)) transporter
VSEAFQVAGAVAATAAVSVAMLAGDRRLRAAGLLAALTIAAALVIGEGWDELEPMRDRPVLFAAVSIGGAAALAALALALRRWPWLLPLLLVAALPFRIPIDVDGAEANLLIPLYVVIGAGTLAFAADAVRARGPEPGRIPRLLAAALAAAIVLYGLQSSYSEDVGFATRNVGFFLVPFAAMFVLLAQERWSPRMLAASLGVLIGESLLFAFVGIGQHVAGEIFWNPVLERSNDFHFYFRVNSLFWDPNIYGRYLALAAVLLLAVIAWTRDPRRIAVLAAVLAVIFAGLTVSFSQTSLVTVLAGITVICALRWSVRWTVIALPFAIVAVLAAIVVLGGTSAAEDEADEVSSGRSTLIEGGIDLARAEPLIGHGSASFPEAFREQEDVRSNRPAISHNEPIAVAAEQGAVGFVVYLGVLVAAFVTLLAGIRGIAPGLGAPASAVGDPAAGGASAIALARLALIAAFIALLVHTIGYAGYLTDPLTWALLAIGGALAARR